MLHLSGFVCLSCEFSKLNLLYGVLDLKMTVYSKVLNSKLTLYRNDGNQLFTLNISDCSLLEPVAQAVTLQFLLNNIT